MSGMLALSISLFPSGANFVLIDYYNAAQRTLYNFDLWQHLVVGKLTHVCWFFFNLLSHIEPILWSFFCVIHQQLVRQLSHVGLYTWRCDTFPSCGSSAQCKYTWGFKLEKNYSVKTLTFSLRWSSDTRLLINNSHWMSKLWNAILSGCCSNRKSLMKEIEPTLWSSSAGYRGFIFQSERRDKVRTIASRTGLVSANRTNKLRLFYLNQTPKRK